MLPDRDLDAFRRQEDLYVRFWRFFEQLEDDIEIALPPSVSLWPLVPTDERTSDMYGDLTLTARLPIRSPHPWRDPHRMPVVWITRADGNMIATVYAIVTDEFGERRDEWRIPAETVLHILEQDEDKKELLKRLMT